MIGLGRMGANMAQRLMRGGHKVVGYDPAEAARAVLEKNGAQTARVSSFIFRPKGRLSAFGKSWQAQLKASILSKALSGAAFVSQQPVSSSCQPQNYLGDSLSMRAGICDVPSAIAHRSTLAN